MYVYIKEYTSMYKGVYVKEYTSIYKGVYNYICKGVYICVCV